MKDGILRTLEFDVFSLGSQPHTCGDARTLEPQTSADLQLQHCESTKRVL